MNETIKQYIVMYEKGYITSTEFVTLCYAADLKDRIAFYKQVIEKDMKNGTKNKES